jgi:hypothetical protein
MEININGVEEFKRAIERNPQVAREEVGKFLVRATAKYRKTIRNNPWKFGQSGGGAPVKSGNLRDMHHTDIRDWIARIYVDRSVDYRWKVHEGEKWIKGRPWLNYAMEQNQQAVDKLGDAMLYAIVNNLAK